MQLINIEVESHMTLVYNNQPIKITPFFTRDKGTIKLGIDAPKALPVNREEIHQKKRFNAKP